MRRDSSAVATLPQASLPTHSIVGVGGSDAEFILRAGLEAQFRSAVLLRGLSLQAIFYPEVEHDVLVGRDSQFGGLSGSSTHRFPFLSIDVPGIHTSVVKEGRVDSELITLLNTGVSDSARYASGFSANTGIPATCPYQASVGPEAVTTTGGIAIAEPAPNATVTPGGAITVTVEPFGGYVPTRVLVMCGDDSQILESPPFTETLYAPIEQTADLAVSAIAVDASGVYATATAVDVRTVQSASLRDIRVENSPLRLVSYAPEERLVVTGLYDDGVTRNITAATMGTSYTSQNPSIATVDSEGWVTARSLGTVAIDVQNSGFYDQAIVVVDSLPLTLRMNPSGPTWPPWSGAAGYDLVRGNLETLRSTGGDFALAPEVCLLSNAPETAVEDDTVPTVGQGLWYVVRYVYAADAKGSYDDPGTGSTRDTGIALSPNGCP